MTSPVIYLPPPKRDTVGAAIQTLQFEERAIQLREEFARGFWLGVSVALPLSLWGGWLLARLSQ